MTARQRIAIQKAGRLTEASLKILEKAGIEVDPGNSPLFSPSKTAPIDVLFLRDKDIPNYLLSGASDLGVVGMNVLDEYYGGEVEAHQVQVLRALPFGSCRMSLAFPENQMPQKLSDLSGLKIATSYPKILKKCLSRHGSFPIEVVKLQGGVELAPLLGLCDGVFDIVSTGATLKKHGLIEFKSLYESRVVLCSTQSPQAKSLTEMVVKRLDSAVKAMSSRYLMMNAPQKNLTEILQVLPGLEAPSIMPLSADSEKVAIHAVTQGKLIWSQAEQLKNLGASSILVVPIETLVE